jgi:DNA-binding PadR family transcriptional regulator
MEKDGLLSANREKLGSRPEKTIYTITDKGIAAFKNMIAGVIEFEYRPTFPSDGVFYFSDYIEDEEILSNLIAYIQKLNKIISNIEKNREKTMHFIPEEDITMANVIFSHHMHHYRAEVEWAEKTLNYLSLKREKL